MRATDIACRLAAPGNRRWRASSNALWTGARSPSHRFEDRRWRAGERFVTTPLGSPKNRGDVVGREESRDLVSRAREGDQGAWSELYRRAYPQLIAFANHRLGAVHDARDAVSETMVRAIGQIERFQGSDDA